MSESETTAASPRIQEADHGIAVSAKTPGGRRLDVRAPRDWVLPVVVFAVAFALRLAYVLQLRTSPYFDVPLVDAETYYQIAQDLLQGRGYGPGAFWQPPLYPTFLALLLKVGNGSLFAVRLCQAVLGSLTCVLVYFIGKEMFSKKVAAVGALMVACCGVLVYFDGELLAPSLLLFLIHLSFFIGIKAQRSGRYGPWAISGLVLGLSAITWAGILLFAPFHVLWAWMSRTDRKPFRRTLIAPACVGVGLMIAILPVTAHNVIRGGDRVLISCNGGVNFYIGNNEHADETLAVRPGYPWQRLMNRAWAEGGAAPGSEQSAFFFRQGLAFAAEQPYLFARNLGVKFWRFWNAGEISRNIDLYETTRHAPILALLLWPTSAFCFPFGLLSPLAIMGMILSWRERKNAYPAFGLVGAVCLAGVLFFVTSRYRTPAIPLVALFAAHGMFRLADIWKRGNLRNRIVSGAALTVLLVLCNLSWLRPAEPDPAEVHYLAAVTVYNRGDHERSATFCRTALETNPDFYPAMIKLGEIAYERGDRREAGDWLTRAVGVAPEDPEANGLLGIVLSALGQPDAALNHIRKAVASDPANETYHYNLALILIALGQIDQAMVVLEETVDLARDKEASCPMFVGAINWMAESMMRNGPSADALVILDWAGTLLPEDVRTIRNQVVAHMMLGHDPLEFVAVMQALVRLAPDDPIAPRLRELLAATGADVP